MSDICSVYRVLAKLAASEFNDIVTGTRFITLPSGELAKLRLAIIDDSFLDIWLSGSGRYSYHWERRVITGDLYRHDNAPHTKWRYVSTFPKHFHNGDEDTVVESHISDDPEEATRIFLSFARRKLLEEQRSH